ncbi:MAG: DUF5916 domain-containing protein [Gemmatimonadota bacterium]
MHLTSLLLALQQFSGATEIEIPRLDEVAVVDGVLDERAWSDAALIDGFRQYEPADGRPAAERTEVRVWYAPDAIWFGITAHDSEPQSIRATRADRDNIGDEDHVVIYLDTFLDRRRAFFFGVNALGVQLDGVRSEGASSAGRAFGGGTDTSPDFAFESSGRPTTGGYVVEVRIPFTSLRYPAGREMSWGLNIERKTQRTGYVDVWPDVRRASASFLAQGGTLTGLHDLERGVVWEMQPFTTVNMPGARADGRWERASPDPSAGVNARLGFTSFSLDATLNPDFSQIEADAGQITVNERFALFLPEKRPFFLEGIELFSTPGQLVYTRRIADPLGGAKLTGKAGSTSIAYLAAVDRHADAEDRRALFNVARMRHDIGTSSLVGVTVTDRTILDGPGYNRVAAADARIVFGGLYYAEGQIGGSWTDDGAGRRSSPIWEAELDRTGRAFGFNYQLNGVGEEFRTQAGFVNRSNVVSARASNRFTYYGQPEAALERVTLFFRPERLWTHTGFGRDGALEGTENANVSFRLRGDWELQARVARDFVELDPGDYALLETVTSSGPQPYVPLDRVSGPTIELSGSTPIYQRFDASASVGGGRVAIFAEGGEGSARSVSASVALRPNPSVRLALGTSYERIDRVLDGTEFARTLLPRLRAEFQPTRAFFLRSIVEYRAERRSALRDARTGDPLRIGGDLDPFERTAAFAANGMQVELLASFEPTPGTAAFLGYGVSFAETDAFAFDRLTRMNDGLFLKLAYQFRR